MRVYLSVRGRDGRKPLRFGEFHEIHDFDAALRAVWALLVNSGWLSCYREKLVANRRRGLEALDLGEESLLR